MLFDTVILTVNQIQDMLDDEDIEVNSDDAGDSDNSDCPEGDVGKLCSKLLETEAEVQFDGRDGEELEGGSLGSARILGHRWRTKVI